MGSHRGLGPTFSPHPKPRKHTASAPTLVWVGKALMGAHGGAT